MKKISTYLLLCLLGFSAQAFERAESECFSIAREHFGKNANPFTKNVNNIQFVGSSSQILGTHTIEATDAFYVYNNGSSFVIVSGDDRIAPILAYSDDASFSTENMPENIKGILQQYTLVAENLDNVGEQSKFSYNRLPVHKAAEVTYPESVEPLLGDIAWNQDAPYNNLCPEGSMTGCVATAMSMITKYYEYPKIGKGRYSYLTPTAGYSVSYDFEEKPFDWKNMIPTYTEGNYTETQSAAVAELMKACGVSVAMNYGQQTSSASALKISDGFTSYLRYNKNILFRVRDAYTTDEWMDLIKNELSNNRPVLYNGSSKSMGHEFVIDGYDANDFVHVNWGWGGLANGYFDIRILDPLDTGIGGGESGSGGYTYSQGMVIGIKPQTVENEASHNWYMNALMLLSTPDENGQLPITETLHLGAVMLANYGAVFNGEVGVAIVEELDEEPISIVGMKTLAPIPGGNGGNLQFDFAIPEDTPNGVYGMYLVAKPFKGEKWERIRTTVGYMPYIVIEVKDGMVTYYDPRQKPEINGSYTVDTELVINKYGSFTVTAKNNGTEYYYGSVGVLITPSTTSDKAAIYVDEVRLAPGEEATVTFTKALVNNDRYQLEEGTSKICGVFSYGEALFPMTSFKNIEIGLAKQPKLTLNGKLATAKPVFGTNEEFVLPLNVSCEGDYNGYIVAAIFPYGATQTDITVPLEVSLEDGQSYDLAIKGYIEPRLKPRKYLVAAYYFDIATGGYTGELGYTTFDVEQSSGIDNDDINSSLEIYPKVVTDVLNIRSADSINQIEVYNIVGQLTKSEQPQSTACELSAQDLPAGHYILVIRTENNIYKERFIKK